MHAYSYARVLHGSTRVNVFIAGRRSIASSDISLNAHTHGSYTNYQIISSNNQLHVWTLFSIMLQ